MKTIYFYNTIKALVLLLVFLVTACHPQKKWLQYVTVKYSQTGCADAWQTGATDSITCVNVAAFLSDKNVAVLGVTIKNDGVQELCNACFCKTGNTIYVSTLEGDDNLATFAKLGFRPQ
jgi:hypothetical protein